MILHIALGIVLGFFLLHLVIWGGALVVLGFLEHPVITILGVLFLVVLVVGLLFG
jgi:hypothetical protein